MRSLIVVAALLLAAPAHAQGLRAEPLSFADGRIVLGGEVTATVGPDDPGFFNYSDYEFNALRNLRVGVTAEVKASRRLHFLTEIRLDRSGQVEPFALYARVRPFPGRRFDIQIGRIPPTFGLFSRQGYGAGNLVVGQPLAYQYLLSLRADSLPATVDDILRMRGRGWLSSFPVGNPDPEPGLPIVQAFRLDTGVQLHGVTGMFEWTGSSTTGSLSNPRVGDDNGGRQLAGRVVFRPLVALALGLSGSRGAFLDRALQPRLATGADVNASVQKAVAFDGEYSFGRFLARGEVLRSTWRLPRVGSVNLESPLAATAAVAEGRYRLVPGIYVAARAERLDFSRLYTPARVAPWEAPVRRLEIAAAWSLLRNVQVKAAWQRNRRDGGRVRHDSLVSSQVIYWF